MLGHETIRHSAGRFALVAFVMIMCIFSVSVLLPFSFSGGVSRSATLQEMQYIRQKIASDEQISQMQQQIDMQQQQINEIWKHIQFGRNETKASGVQDAQRTQMVDVFQPHEQQRMHLTAITQKVRKLSKVFIHSYIRTFLMYTHSGLHSATPRSLILSLSHTHRHRWVKKCMHSKTGSMGLRMALSLR